MNKNLPLFQACKKASQSLALVDVKKIDSLLIKLAEATEKNIPYILEANFMDLERMPEEDPRYDRLKLTEDRIRGIAADLRNVAGLESPLNKVLEERTLENGLLLEKIAVPLGVIGIIYESRPNVTFDVFALCVKSGNACMLKGGSDADFSNRAITTLIQKVLREQQFDENVITLLPAERESADELMNAVDFVDVIIPRGSQRLIDHVRSNAKVPVIETGAGIVHTYIDEFAEPSKGIDIAFNAKTRRVSVCNALDCLLIHKSRLGDLKKLGEQLKKENVIIYADDSSYNKLKGNYPDKLLFRALPEHFGTEFLDYKMSVKTVGSIEEAIEHITSYSSKHSEAIVTEDESRANYFKKAVDAAAVYINASTAFTDGAQFGLGAEIGISTQKLHARGPMALKELTSYKWVIEGEGQVRAK